LHKTSAYYIKGSLAGAGIQRADDVTIQLLKAADKKLVKMEFPDESRGLRIAEIFNVVIVDLIL
jgi:hypothetical protein